MISVESVQMTLKLAIWRICKDKKKYSHLKALSLKAYFRKNSLSSHRFHLSKIIFFEPNSFMHMFSVSILYRQHIKLLHQKLW